MQQSNCHDQVTHLPGIPEENKIEKEAQIINLYSLL